MTCKKCGVEQPVDSFYPHRRVCKKCHNTASSRWRQANPERAATIYQQWVAANPERVKIRNLRWQLSNPDRLAAHRALNNAVLAGKVSKPSVCSRCDTPTWPLHGHHKDYTKPLDATWLCPQCHSAAHKEIKNGG